MAQLRLMVALAEYRAHTGCPTHVTQCTNVISQRKTAQSHCFGALAHFRQYRDSHAMLCVFKPIITVQLMTESDTAHAMCCQRQTGSGVLALLLPIYV